MNKVISINLNGNAYQLEEPGFGALSAYLSQARDRLADNPDREEIMADLEQSVADKFRRFLTPTKTVLTEEEVASIIKEMGPVDGGPGAAPNGEPSPRRLYRIKEGALLGGVTTGIAAYFGLDVVLVRVILVVLTVLSSGSLIFAYLLGWIFIPEARTGREQAAAQGVPFTAQELLARAKSEYARFGGKKDQWHRQWRDWRRESKRQARMDKAWERQQLRYVHHHSFLGELFGLIALTFGIWFGYHHVPVIHEFLDAVWSLWRHVADQIAQFILSQDTGYRP